MRLQQLEAFQMVARTLNVTRSAERLNYAQSSVSEQIQNLETEVGVALFEREGRRLRLTAAGERLLVYADRILTLTAEARTAVTGLGTLQETLIVAAPETLCVHRLPAVLAALREREPQLRIVVRPASRAELHRAIPEGEADVCIGIGEAPSHRTVAVESLDPEPLVLVAAPHHPLAGCDFVTNAQLSATVWIATEPGCVYRDAFERGVGTSGPWPAMEVSSIHTLVNCVVQGQGITFVPEMAVVDELMRGTLIRLSWEAPSQPMCPVWMAWSDDQNSSNVRAVIEIIRETSRAS